MASWWANCLLEQRNVFWSADKTVFFVTVTSVDSHVVVNYSVLCPLSRCLSLSWFVLHLATICDLWHSCIASTEGTDRKADIWWETDRKWERLEAVLELWCCYFTAATLPPYQPAHPALLIEPAASQSLAEIDCVAVSITSYNSPSFRCWTLRLRPLLVIYLLWAFLIWAWVAHHCSQRVWLREWKLLSLAEDLWTCDMVPVQASGKERTKTASYRLVFPESHTNEPYLLPKSPRPFSLLLCGSCFFTWSFEGHRDALLHFPQWLCSSLTCIP